MKKELRGNWYKKNGYYYVRVHYYVGNERKTKNFPTGIQVDERRMKKLDREADRKVAEILANFVIPGLENELHTKEEMFADTVEHWLQHQKGALAASTMAGYQYYANDVMLYFREICPIKTVDLTSSMVEQYQNWERARRQTDYTGEYKKKTKFSDGSGIENTIKHRTTLIRSVLQDAKREGTVARNVASARDARVSLPSPQRNEFSVLSENEAMEFIRLLEKEELWFKAAVLMALLWGLRRSEIIGIRVWAIDWEVGQIVVDHTVTQQTIDGKNTITPKPFTKNKKPKCFALISPLNQVLKELMEEHKNNAIMFGDDYDHFWDGYLMRYADGKLVTPNALTAAFEKFVNKHNLKHIRLHDLRHSCASILYANGTDLLTIQEILGHAQLTTTISYTHKISEKKGIAIEQMSSMLTGENERRDENEKSG